MRLYHGTLSPLQPGDRIVSSNEITRLGTTVFSNLTALYTDTGRRLGFGEDSGRMELEDGTTVQREDVVYLSDQVHDAESWGGMPLLKSSAADFNRYHDAGAGSVNTYEVEPVNPRRPRKAHRHSEHEWIADSAVIIRLVQREPLLHFCRNDDCGDDLPEGFELGQPCPSCGALTR